MTSQNKQIMVESMSAVERALDNAFCAGENECRAAMLAKINDENFLFGLRDADLSGIGSTSIIAEAMRKLVNSL